MHIVETSLQRTNTPLVVVCQQRACQEERTRIIKQYYTALILPAYTVSGGRKACKVTIL
jgi:hypothetical protein